MQSRQILPGRYWKGQVEKGLGGRRDVGALEALDLGYETAFE